jgi:hypothetical protein
MEGNFNPAKNNDYAHHSKTSTLAYICRDGHSVKMGPETVSADSSLDSRGQFQMGFKTG